jgi:hypothetical protein
MRPQATEVLLNVLAGSPLFVTLRRARDIFRAPDPDAVATAVLNRYRTRRAILGEDRIRGASLLEIGSGREFGLALLLVAMGAERVVNVEIDRYGFIDDASFYRRLVDRARAEGHELRWPPEGLVEVDGGRRVRPDGRRVIVRLGESAASLSDADASFDVTFSVSVLQHIRRKDCASTARELLRVTRRGGRGYHRLDFGGLQRPSNPFWHLCFDEPAFAAMFDGRDTYTNRYRLDDLERVFLEAGFDEVRFDDVQLHDDRARPLFEATRAAFAPEFAGRPAEILFAQTGLLVLGRSS